MNKRVLIISPYFPPSNAADMQRIRMSLPYFSQFGWDAEVVIVDPKHSEIAKDDLLMQSLPANIKIHIVKAFSKKWTSKFGLGSVALRSLWFYRRKVNALLKSSHFDLVYFSTTQFPLCILGAYWKKRFGIPYVIDMQDPWHSDYYKDKPKHQQPKKYWFSYRLNRYLEPKALRHVSGLISVSESYISDLKARYLEISDIPAETITFGAFERDMQIAKKNRHLFTSLLDPGSVNLVYVGRGGADMHKAISPLFKALKDGLNNNPLSFTKLKLYFIGTSYAPSGQGLPTILPLAQQFGVGEHVVEITDRISYYHTLATLQQADALFIPGSDDPKYTASKIYPYLMTRKPLIAIFNNNSNTITALKEGTENAIVLTFGKENDPSLADTLYPILDSIAKGILEPTGLTEKFKNYSAENLTGKQAELFDRSLKHFERENTNA